jgi:F0F1-type ATP synthase membrane subunit b/b'
MSDNAEEGIARIQATAARQQGNEAAHIANQQQRASRYIGERIVTFVAVIAALLLVGVWATAKSPLILYGSLALLICLVIAWGFMRKRRMEAERSRRRQLAASYSERDGKA